MGGDEGARMEDDMSARELKAEGAVTTVCMSPISVGDSSCWTSRSAAFSRPGPAVIVRGDSELCDEYGNGKVGVGSCWPMAILRGKKRSVI